jgi:hypothetical protein
MNFSKHTDPKRCQLLAKSPLLPSRVPAVVYYFPILVERILLFDHQTSPFYSNMFQNEADAGPFKSPSTA